METINIIYFGVLSEICAKSTEELDFTGTLDELQNLLIQKYPDLASQHFQYSLNQEISSLSDSVKPGDEVALLPPFTGG
ncbi:MAG: MoaD/ThiS family protein [Bacteroidetes bacterium]|jgi:molybdopterin converting factor small subunit|nr:MoaD/ThiS family protein [Bacteroidota bacterium]MBT3747686.1 MoaD/ThiS family protein [Bacteroidota bacterium]MBT4398392.1 MoaD/ThiS family protein [Bacteroidota bacterium]MBT4411814.1 MoaD/ThiS family protein [Bacteroidota bacterium]MBT5427508.1 MoaD/ThiS family protein [Bacteroidota bacterium]